MNTLITVMIMCFPQIFQALLIRHGVNIAISVTMSKQNHNHSTSEGEILTKYIKKKKKRKKHLFLCLRDVFMRFSVCEREMLSKD